MTPCSELALLPCILFLAPATHLFSDRDWQPKALRPLLAPLDLL